MSKPKILVARAIFPRPSSASRSISRSSRTSPTRAGARSSSTAKLQGKQGAFTTGSERIDAAVLDACPDLKICANMAVGYNNFDVDAMAAHGVVGTNAPDVLTETTADFGFALLMATARRIAESEHFLRAASGRSGASTCSRAPTSTAHAGHHRHGPHRAGHREARRARLRHEGDLSQPLAARRRARGRMQGQLREQGRAAQDRRPRGAGGAVLGALRTTPSARPSSR